MNVALGGTLLTEVQDIDGRMDHRGPDGGHDQRFALRQNVKIAENSCLAGVFGAGEIMVNSVHRQAVDRLGPNLMIEAVAQDGTVEAISVRNAPAFAVGVQWHPEYWAATDDNSAKIFRAFGDAVRAHNAARGGYSAAAE
jgi:putative glutamine amidotransferase